MTGGQIILAMGAEDAGAAVRRAVASLRRSKPLAEMGRWPLKSAAIQTGGAQGMQTLDQCLTELVAKGQVSKEEARYKAQNKDSV